MTVSYFASSRLPRILPGTRSAPSHTHRFLSGTTMMKTVMIMMVMMVMMMAHSQIYGNYNDSFNFMLGNKRESNTQTEISKPLEWVSDQYHCPHPSSGYLISIIAVVI